jgi:hypothetical protein
MCTVLGQPVGNAEHKSQSTLVCTLHSSLALWETNTAVTSQPISNGLTDSDSRQPKYSDRNPYQCNFFHHWSQMDCQWMILTGKIRILCFVDRASWYGPCKWSTWHTIFSCMFTSILFMFRAVMCPSSGELLHQCDTWFMSLCVDERLVCIPEPDGHLHSVINQVSHWYNNSPDDGHMAAWNMQRIETNIQEKTVSQVGYLQGSKSELFREQRVCPSVNLSSGNPHMDWKMLAWNQRIQRKGCLSATPYGLAPAVRDRRPPATKGLG